MKNHNDISHSDIANNEHDEVITQNLREAYGQIQFRDEWAERVLRKLVSESDRQSTPAKSRVSESFRGSSMSRLLGRRTLALAATVVLAALGAYWLVSNTRRPASSDPRDSELTKRITQPAEEIPELQEAFFSLTESRQQIDTITGTPGYLAAKLTDDPEFEIYMVLPQNNGKQF